MNEHFLQYFFPAIRGCFSWPFARMFINLQKKLMRIFLWRKTSGIDDFASHKAFISRKFLDNFCLTSLFALPKLQFNCCLLLENFVRRNLKEQQWGMENEVVQIMKMFGEDVNRGFNGKLLELFLNGFMIRNFKMY